MSVVDNGADGAFRSLLPMLAATRYLVPLREGGSMPAILDTDGGGLFVAKFRGAGQGAKALVAEAIVALLARAAGLPVPEPALIELDEGFGRTEPDPEIQDILKGSRGLNIGLRYLEGAFNYDPLAVPDIDPDLAADIVWLDAFVTNIDRTARNSNLMVWQGGIWLIDHGAALYFHHNWPTADPGNPFPAIRNHVLLQFAGDIGKADVRMREKLSDALIQGTLDSVPDQLLMDAPVGTTPSFDSAEEHRAAYCRYFTERLGGEPRFVEQAVHAARELADDQPQAKGYRR